MAQCSLLVPAFSLELGASLLKQTADNFGVDESQVELFELVPVTKITKPTNIAVKLKASSLTLTKIEDVLTQRDQLLIQLQRSRETLNTCLQEVQNLNSVQQVHIKKLEDKNRKLKNFLKTQLENAESLRVATKETVENLREEFDKVVKELISIKESKSNSKYKQSSSKPNFSKMTF